MQTAPLVRVCTACHLTKFKQLLIGQLSGVRKNAYFKATHEKSDVCCAPTQTFSGAWVQYFFGYEMGNFPSKTTFMRWI